MKLLSDIINDLVDSEGDLSAALLKTKVLSYRIDNLTLANWVDCELNGYGIDNPLPEYRIMDARVTMNYLNGHVHFKDQPIPMVGMKEIVRNQLEEVELREAIATLQSYAAIKDVLSLPVPAEVVAYVENYLRKGGDVYPNFSITSITKLFAPFGAVQALAKVRSRLLSFMLQIEKEFGSTTDIESLKARNQQVTNIMYHTINNTGDGNTVNTGNNSTVNSNVTINKGDLSSLRDRLQALGVQKADIDSLTSVIQSEAADIDSKRYGPEVNKWLQKMLSKALDGSWQIGIGTAGGVLAELINSYYGIK